MSELKARRNVCIPTLSGEGGVGSVWEHGHTHTCIGTYVIIVSAIGGEDLLAPANWMLWLATKKIGQPQLKFTKSEEMLKGTVSPDQTNYWRV